MSRYRRGLLGVGSAGLTVVVVLVAASCGVPGDDQDRPLAANEIAFQPLPEPTIAATTTTTTPPVTTAVRPTPTTTTTTIATSTTVPIVFPLDVYWISGSMIRPMRRLNVEATLESAIDALRAGPSFSDSEEGLRSAIPSADTIDSAMVQSGTATVSLAPSFLTLPGNEQTLAIAQIIYTLTNLPGVGLVVFRLGDRPLSVPTADGQPSNGALSRDDYVSLLAPVSPLPRVPETTTVPNDRRGGRY